MSKPIVVAMTGASGAIYAVRLLESLLAAERDVHLVISESGAAVCRQELGVAPRIDGSNIGELFPAARRFLLCDRPSSAAGEQNGEILAPDESPSPWDLSRLIVHHPKDYFTPIASGSFLTGGMVICPCSGSTLSGVARSSASNLIQRAAEVHLKEHRKLIVVPRETPLSTLQLENMMRLSQVGVVVLPAAPGWYHGVTGLSDLVDFVVARILDQLDVPNTHIQRWAAN